MTDFRALCAELCQEFASLYSDMSARVDFNDVYMERIDNLLDRGSAALAQPEPQGAICSPCEWWGAEVENECKLGLNPPRSLADCAFSRFDAQPEPKASKPAPNYDRVSEVATEAQIRSAAQYLVKKHGCDGDLVPAIRYAIARWGIHD